MSSGEYTGTVFRLPNKNLSMPFIGEMYIGGSLFSVAIAFTALGYFSQSLDQRMKAGNSSTVNAALIFGPLLAAFQIFFLRGDLMNATAYLFPQLLCLVPYFERSRYGGKSWLLSLPIIEFAFRGDRHTSSSVDRPSYISPLSDVLVLAAGMIQSRKDAARLRAGQRPWPELKRRVEIALASNEFNRSCHNRITPRESIEADLQGDGLAVQPDAFGEGGWRPGSIASREAAGSGPIRAGGTGWAVTYFVDAISRWGFGKF